MANKNQNLWQTVQFKNFAKLQRGFDLPKQDRINGIYPVVASTSITAYHNKYKVNAPCVTTGRSGSLGVVLYINVDCWPLNTVLWVKDFYGNNPKFVYYKLKTLNLEKFNAGAGVPTLNKNHLDKINIEIPDVPTQTRIASILSAYDDLIKNNEKRIKALEEMAQLLYIEWFVKFKFPGHEKVKMVDSGTKFGKIPEGWEVKKLKDIANVVSGYAFKSSEFIETGVPVIKIKNITSDRKVDVESTDFVSPSMLTKKILKYVLKDGDIIVAMTGATAGKIGRVATELDMLLNQRVAKIEPHNGYYSFLWGSVETEEAQRRFYRLAGGAAQPNMSAEQIEEIKILVPTMDVVTIYDDMVLDNLRLINALQKLCKPLIRIRDLLIPLLVTGIRELK